MTGKCDQCEREPVTVEPLALLDGDVATLQVLVCERCGESDEPISLGAQERAMNREAERWTI